MSFESQITRNIKQAYSDAVRCLPQDEFSPADRAAVGRDAAYQCAKRLGLHESLIRILMAEIARQGRQ